MRKNIHTEADFKGIAKYSVGQKVYTVESYNPSMGYTYPPLRYYIKEHIISGLTIAALNYRSIDTTHISYYGNNKYDLVFEEHSYDSKEKALDKLKIKIEEDYKWYKEKAIEYDKLCDERYKQWLKDYEIEKNK